MRDLRDAALQLATYLARHPAAKRGYVLASLVRVSAKRVRAEWQSIKQVLTPKIAGRMRLVAVVDGTEIADPSNAARTPVVERFLEFVTKSSVGDARNVSPNADDARAGSSPGPTWRHLEVEKVLVHRWLLGEGPIAIGALIRQVGCSYPTAIQAIRRLSGSGMIERGRGRSVALSRYPRDRWADLWRVQRTVYPPEEFVDPTGDPGAVEGIVRRLNRLRPKGAAIGGVVAARAWDPAFDLNGTPRVDVVVQTPAARGSDSGRWIREATEFVRRLDPALVRRTRDVRGATVLALHPTYRRDPLFREAAAPSEVPLAAPVEVLFHLNELGLTAQAGELLRHLRKDAIA